MNGVAVATKEPITTNLRAYGDYREAMWGEPAMSNLNRSIDEGMEEFLRRNCVVSTHAAWNFHGRVWWQGGCFHEQVSVHHVQVAQYRAPSLVELMRIVNDAHGWD